MQGGQGSGRGVYVVRRLVAVLVLLVILALLVPLACQALVGSGDQSSTQEEPETTTVSPAGSANEGSIAGGDTTSGATEGTVAENEGAGRRSDGDQDSTEGASEEDSGEVAVSDESSDEDQDGEVQDLEAAADLADVPAVPAANPLAPIPDVGIGNQPPATQPLAFGPPLPPAILEAPPVLEAPPAVPDVPPVLEAPPVVPEPPSAPPVLEASPTPQETVFFYEPVSYELVSFDESDVFAEPDFFEEPVPSDAVAPVDTVVVPERRNSAPSSIPTTASIGSARSSSEVPMAVIGSS